MLDRLVSTVKGSTRRSKQPEQTHEASRRESDWGQGAETRDDHRYTSPQRSGIPLTVPAGQEDPRDYGFKYIDSTIERKEQGEWRRIDPSLARAGDRRADLHQRKSYFRRDRFYSDTKEWTTYTTLGVGSGGASG